MQDNSSKTGRVPVVVHLNATELSAVEAWRCANGVNTHSDAISELVRFGLLSQIRRVYERSQRDRDTTTAGDS